MITTTTARLIRCRYLRRNGQQCTAEVADPDMEVLLCPKHLVRARAWTPYEERTAYKTDIEHTTRR